MISKKHFTKSIATILSTLTFLTAVSPCTFAKNNPKTAQTKQITKNNPKAIQTRLISKAGIFLAGAGLVTAGIATAIAIYKSHQSSIVEKIQKAMKDKDYQTVRNLMENNPCCKNICNSLLYQAVYDNNSEIVDFSVEQGADINDKNTMKFLLTQIIMRDQQLKTTFLHLYGLRNYFQAQNITEKECLLCYETKAVNEFQCIFDCHFSDNEICFEHAICTHCLRGMENATPNLCCPFCQQNRIMEIY